MGLVLIKERRILFSEFALSKSQYLYNKNRSMCDLHDSVDEFGDHDTPYSKMAAVSDDLGRVA